MYIMYTHNDVIRIIICNVLIAEAGELFDTKPNQKIGEIVEQWKEDWNVNPEELGSYLEGDIMINSASLRNNLDGDMLWNNGIIPYVITGNYNSNGMEILHWAFDQYNRKTCVWFRPKTFTDVDYIQITNNKSGCWSLIGRQGGMQEVNLQYPGCISHLRPGTVLHELMHVIGIAHEHTRSDRDQYIAIIHQNIQPSKLLNFDKDPLSTFNGMVPYDYSSLMHYSKFAFSRARLLPTIALRVTDNLIRNVPASLHMGQRIMFSSNDLALINQIYCRNEPERDMMPDEGPHENHILQLLKIEMMRNTLE